MSVPLAVGVQIDIQRSDGRIHSAVVSGIKHEIRSCTVEWFENGETKGKELDYDVLQTLNPTVVFDPQTASTNGHQTGASTRNTTVNTTAQASSRIPMNQIRTEKKRTEEIPAQRVTSGKRRATNAARPTSVTKPPAENNGVDVSESQQSLGAANGGANRAGPSGIGGISAGDRKSNCVREIEKISQQRQDRRANNEAKRTHEAQHFDKTQANWEFRKMISEYRSGLDMQPLLEMGEQQEHQITVCVRKRPMNKKESGRKDIDVITMPTKDLVIIHEPKTKVDLTKYLENQQFRFDYCFNDTAGNELVYWYTAKPLVHSIFEGGFATCFAYGQTGSGKTHTMGGVFQAKGIQDCTKGIYALSASDVFQQLTSRYSNSGLYVTVSFFEIYSGKVYDLLNEKEKLRVLEDAKGIVQIVGLTEEEVFNVEDVLEKIRSGNQVRTSGQTSANLHSSRSHAIFQIALHREKTRKLHGKFSLIDLAGNERGADTMSSDRLTRQEGAEINKSLLALKECIRALGKKDSYLPFRASKLTQVLRDSFIGEKARTCMIAAISPGLSCCEHTLNTIRYSDRVKELGPGEPTDNLMLAAVPGPSTKQVNGHVPATPEGAGKSSNGQSGTSAMSPQNSDLIALRRGNELEMDEDMIRMHEVVNALNEAEEDCLDELKILQERLIMVSKQTSRLQSMAKRVDYDQVNFVNENKELLRQLRTTVTQYESKLDQFQRELQKEEDVSMEMTKKKKLQGGRK